MLRLAPKCTSDHEFSPTTHLWSKGQALSKVSMKKQTLVILLNLHPQVQIFQYFLKNWVVDIKDFCKPMYNGCFKKEALHFCLFTKTNKNHLRCDRKLDFCQSTILTKRVIHRNLLCWNLYIGQAHFLTASDKIQANKKKKKTRKFVTFTPLNVNFHTHSYPAGNSIKTGNIFF